MATYTGYDGYNPDEAARVKRLRETADMLNQTSAAPRPIRHWSQGVQQLAQALMARQAGERADAAETAYSDNVKRAAEMAINTAIPGDASQAAYGQYTPSMIENATMLAGGGPPVRDGFNGFTPEQQDMGSRNARARALLPFLGPVGAIQYDQQEQAAKKADRRYEDETKYARSRDARGDFVTDRGFQFGVDRAAKGDEQWRLGYDQDANQFGQTMGLQRDQLGESRRHNQAMEGISATTAQAKPTPMQTAVDKNWADDLVNWQINGAANFGKQMTQLSGAVQRLKGGEELSGPGTTALIGPTRDWWGQAGKDVQQQVQEVVQGSLREVLGPQFTQKEGEGIMSRTFDPTLEEGVNAQRVERLMAQLQLAAQQKNAALEYFNKNGTMNGYQGHVPSVADFSAAIASVPAGGAKNPDGTPMTKQSAADLKRFMEIAGLPGNTDLAAQIEAVLGQPDQPAGPTTEDLVNKWLK